MSIQDQTPSKWPFHKEIIEAYLKGELKQPKGDFVAYHLNEERAKLGDKYLIWDHWENFVNGCKLSEEVNKKKLNFLWYGK